MLRIKVTSSPVTYFYWGGEWEIRPTYTDFGTLFGAEIPIITLTPAQYDTFKSWVDGQIQARLEDIAAVVG